MHFPDHRIARDAAELGCDLARREAIRPELFQKLDPLIRPRHAQPSLNLSAKLLRESPLAPGSASPPNTHSTTTLQKTSAARNVVLDDQKATIWLESGARLALLASTHSCTRVDELGTNRVRNAQLSCVDSRAGGNRMLFRAARRGGTFRLSRAAFERAALRAKL